MDKDKWRGLRIKPEVGEKWKIEAFRDSNFAGDKNGRRSVTEFVVLACGVPITWKSKSQAYLTLSSTEAEYVAL